uniref:CD55 molecule (Cromer blood group) n=1 Tax=Catagonus wagneri TaxID=51154 RepID=A0A8C3VNG2_9CETA
MSPPPPSAPAVLRLLGGLTLPLLGLLCAPAAQGACSLPPDVPNAQPVLGALARFPEQTTVTYKCNKGFVKVPGKSDSVLCLDDKWSDIGEFCSRSCDVPTRLPFASLKKSYSKQNYFPEGSTVEYECRLGYRRDPTLSGNLTCLQNFTWSKPDEFCKKKQCPTPGDLKNGHVNITTDLLFGASIFFSCNTGYKLVGATSSYCFPVENDVGWSDPLPECQEIFCPEPPSIVHGTIQDKRSSYAYRQSVTYTCNKGFTLHGQSSIYCAIKEDQGEWSGPAPECKETLPAVESTPAFEKPITVNVPATKHPAVPRATTRFHATSTSKGRGSPSSGVGITASALITLMRTTKQLMLHFII